MFNTCQPFNVADGDKEGQLVPVVAMAPHDIPKSHTNTIILPLKLQNQVRIANTI